MVEVEYACAHTHTRHINFDGKFVPHLTQRNEESKNEDNGHIHTLIQ